MSLAVQKALSIRGFALGLMSVALLAMPAEGQTTTYLAFGDSITEGVGDDASRQEKGYPPRLEQLFLDAGQTATVINAGLGGERTPDGLTRIDPLLNQGGDVLLLMEGTNDVGAGLSLETIRFNLAEMARKAEAQGFSVVFGTTIPRAPNANRDPQNLATQQLNQDIRDLAGDTQRRLADPFEVFGGTSNLFRDLYDDTDLGDTVGHPYGTAHVLGLEVGVAEVIREDREIIPVDPPVIIEVRDTDIAALTSGTPEGASDDDEIRPIDSAILVQISL